MADVLLNKVINEEISSNSLTKWLLNAIPENNMDFQDISSSGVGQIDFITYFLNFIHEEVPCCSKSRLSETPLNTPKRFEKEQIYNRKETNIAFKPNLFTTRPPIVDDQNSSVDLNLKYSVEKHTTPKTTKTPGYRNDGYFSPISPLYRNPHQNTFSPKETKQSYGNGKYADKYSCCLGDFLVTTSKSASKKKKHIQPIDFKKETPRRINPTSICQKQVDSGFQKTENSFNFEKYVEEMPGKTATEQRNLLVEERIKILSRKDSIENTSQTVLRRHNSSSSSDVKPTLSMVTFKSNINCVVNIYKTILEHNLVLNITSEIYFLISLFLSKENYNSQQSIRTFDFSGNDEGDDCSLGVDFLDSNNILLKPLENNKKPAKSVLYNSEIFKTIHNVVYFAVKCLETQIKVIKFYDKTTIRLLAENVRIKDVSVELSKKLMTYSEEKAEKPYIEIIPSISQSNVCFNIDTDNKDNFPDQLGFHAFRKQRDLFYEILRIWETHHLAKDWNFSMAAGGKLRSLFNFHSGPTNYVHLARLFKNQLLSSCAKGPKEKGLSECTLSFVPSLAIDADKLSRLTNRLVTKQATNGINSLPVFTGYQEFFRDFIVFSSNYFFNKHLCDCIISEIIELNDTKFSGVEIEDGGNEADLITSKLYVDCLKNLRILAKFLGFIESLPYSSNVPNLPANIVEAQIKIRAQSIPPLDIKSLLHASIEKHSVVFIIPWLTKYLAMLDYVTLRLPYYRSLHLKLFDLYQNYESSEIPDYNIAVIKFCLGWLFELPHFPDIEYFNFCSKVIDAKQPKAGLNRSGVYRNGINGTKTKLKAKHLDYMKIVNQSVLYLCCPYLEEIKRILSNNAPGSNVAVKYITPVTAVESNNEMARKKLEQQLEEAFFSGQPTSMKKTVEFVSERIASSAVKYVCQDLVPNAKAEAIKDLIENLLKTNLIDDCVDDNQRKGVLRKQAAALAQTHLTRFLQTCEEEVQKLSNQKIPPTIDSLLPVDTLEEVKNVCIGITKKIYKERVTQWINNHVNLMVFSKDFDSEIQKNNTNKKRCDREKVPNLLPGGGRNCEHNENALSGLHVLNSIREVCCEITENDDITSEYVLKILQETYKSLTQRNDINDMMVATISMTVFDLCLLLVTFLPSLMSYPNGDLLGNFLKIWALQPNTNSMFKALFCPRNLNMLQDAPKKEHAWDLFALVVSSLLDKQLIEQDDLESQCTGFYSREWDKETLDNFSRFLKKLVSCGGCGDIDKVAYLLDFLSDFCSDLIRLCRDVVIC